MDPSQIPEPAASSGWRRPHPLKSPMTATRGGVGRPDRERHAGVSPLRRRVGAEVLVDPRVGPFGEEVQIHVAQS